MKQQERLDFLLEKLKEDSVQYKNLQVEENETAKKEGTEQHVKNMKVSEYPSHIQKLYKETHER